MKISNLIRRRPSLQWPAHVLGLYTAHTQTSGPERETLAQLAQGRRRLAEIGVYQGVTAALLSSVMDRQGVYFAIDPYLEGRLGIDFNYLIARREVSKKAVGEVVWLRTTGAEAPLDPRVSGTAVDFLFIDGDHSYEGLKGDWEAWRDKVATGGVVALHDTRGGGFGCQKYMEEVIVPDNNFEIIAEVDSLTAFRRVA